VIEQQFINPVVEVARPFDEYRGRPQTIDQLRDQHGTMVVCKGLTVKYPTKLSTKVIVPRSCVKKAPDKLRFQGIATEGLNNRDETKISKAVARG